MSQNDFTIANQGFPAFRADLNSALQALASNSSGATAPSTTFSNMWWYDSSNNIMYIRNEDNDAWIKFAELDQTNDKFVLSGTLQLDDGTVSAPALTFNSDTNMGIYRGGTDILKFVTAGTDAITIDASQNVDVTGTVTAGGLTVQDASAGRVLTGIFQNTTNAAGTSSGISLRNSADTTSVNLSSERVGSNAGADLVITGFDNAGVEKNFMRITEDNDISFYEDTGTTPKFFWDSSAESLGIGTTSPDTYNSSFNQLVIEKGSNAGITIATPTTGLGQIAFADGTTGDQAYRGLLRYDHNTDHFAFYTAGLNEAMRIDSNLNVLVGVTSTTIPGVGNTTEGVTLRTSNGSASSIVASRATASAGYFNINADGDILSLRRSGTQIGGIGNASSKLYIASTGNSGIRFRDDLNCITPCNADGTNSDNDQNLGQASVRYNTIFATNSTINTSDRTEKQDIEELSDAEQRVAVACKGLMRKYRWKSSVAEKGDNARTHFGIIAQDLQDAFTAEGLDASKYAMFCSNTWWELDGEIYKTEEEAPEDATQRTRLGVRYNQLLAFIISAI